MISTPGNNSKENSNDVHYFTDAKGDTIPTGTTTRIASEKVISVEDPQQWVLKPPRVIKHYRGEMPLGPGAILESPLLVSSVSQRKIEPRHLEFERETIRLSRKQEISFRSNESNGSYRIRELGMDQGLTSNDISLPSQDSNGVIWYCHGPLISLDGTHVREYVPESGEVFSTGSAITRDRKHRMWMNYGWGNYLCFFDGISLHRLMNLSFQILGADNQENLILETDSAVYCIKDDSLHYLCQDFWINYGVSHCSGDDKGRLFIPGKYGYFGILEKDTLTTYNLKSESGTINGIKKTSDGQLWFACDNGLFSLKDDILKRYGSADGLSGSNVQEILIDAKDRIWVSYLNGAIDIIWNGNLVKIGDEDFKIYRSKSDSSPIMFLDSDERVWICDYGGRFIIVDDSYLYSIMPNAGELRELYGDLAVANNGDIWISGTKGLYKYTAEDGMIRFYDDFHRRYKIGNERLSIAHDGENLWVAFELPSLAAVINKDTVLAYLKNQGVTKPISDIEIDGEGTVWLGGPDGLLSFDGAFFTDRLPWISGHVNEMSIDQTGKLILAHSNGNVFQHRGEHWFISGVNEGLGLTPWTVERMDSVSLIAGSWTKGLGCLSEDQSLLINRNSGLVNNNIMSISVDSAGNIWVRTEGGINVLNHQNIHDHLLGEADLKVDYINHRDGLKYNTFAYHMDDVITGDSLWFSNLDQVHVLDYQRYSRIGTKAKLQLTGVLLNEIQIDFHDNDIQEVSYDPPKPFTDIPQNLKVDYTYNNFLFEFSNVDITAPHINKYRHRIKELDREWSRASSVNQAEYTNLPPGKFTFEAQVLGHGFEWSKPLSYQFEVLPPWYRTWLAYAMYLVLLALIIWVFSRWQNYRLTLDNIKLEALVSDRTAELSKEKKKSDELLLNILPSEIAEELKHTGKAEARIHNEVSILFSDLVGFTALSEKLGASALVDLLNRCFKAFDEIMRNHQLEKIKTIGDAYMASTSLSGSGGNIEDLIKAGLEMQEVVKEIGKGFENGGTPELSMRIGIHTGHVVAGIVGLDKFQYDLWGDAVNTANRVEQGGESGKVNISSDTYELVKEIPSFEFEYRGPIAVKGKGKIDMYFVSMKP